MFDGQLEKIKKKKKGCIATIENFLTELQDARTQAEEIEQQCDEAINELEDMQEDAQQVRRFVDRVTEEW